MTVRVQGAFRIRLGGEDWSDWTDNTITDFYRRVFEAGATNPTERLFISSSQADGDARTEMLPAFVALTPGTINTDGVALLTTYIVTFPAAGVSRTIYTAGLAHQALSNGWVREIVAVTRRSNPIVQGPAQTADLQYRLTYSAT